MDQSNEAQRELPRYKCHKEVWAVKIKSIRQLLAGGAVITPEEAGYADIAVSHDFVLKHLPQAGGYYVVYEDGYKSFSPAEAFEGGYTRVGDEESKR
jgi:hypothetical protein